MLKRQNYFFFYLQAESGLDPKRKGENECSSGPDNIYSFKGQEIREMFQFCCYMVCTLQDPGSVILIGSILLDKINQVKRVAKNCVFC